MQFFVGGYGKDSLHRCEYGPAGMKILETYETENASYLCMSPDRKYLYAAVENENGCIAAFSVEDDGKLCYLGNDSTGGRFPCYVSVSGNKLYAANYGSGSTVIFNIETIFDEHVDIEHIDLYQPLLLYHNRFGTPSKAVAGRQDSPHAHYIQPIQIGERVTAWACDLGLDAVLIFDGQGEMLKYIEMPRGFGARHIAFGHKQPIAYVVGELAQAVLAIKYDEALNITVSGPVPIFETPAHGTCAAIRVSPDGRLLVSNRGTNAISVLKLKENGEIAGIESIFMLEGDCPRDFTFTPDGKKVFVAYQKSDFIEVFEWNNGLISTGERLTIQKPTCIAIP